MRGVGRGKSGISGTKSGPGKTRSTGAKPKTESKSQSKTQSKALRGKAALADPLERERLADAETLRQLKIAHEATRLKSVECEEIRARFETALRGAQIHVYSQDRDLRYTWVFNPRDADAGRRGTGFGLEIVRKRLAASFGDRAALAIEPAPEGYRVSVTIPVEEAAA